MTKLYQPTDKEEAEMYLETRIELLQKNILLIEKILDVVNKPTKTNDQGKATSIILTYKNSTGELNTHIMNTILHQNVMYGKELIKELKKLKGWN